MAFLFPQDQINEVKRQERERANDDRISGLPVPFVWGNGVDVDLRRLYGVPELTMHAVVTDDQGGYLTNMLPETADSEPPHNGQQVLVNMTAGGKFGQHVLSHRQEAVVYTSSAGGAAMSGTEVPPAQVPGQPPWRHLGGAFWVYP